MNDNFRDKGWTLLHFLYRGDLAERSLQLVEGLAPAFPECIHE